MNYFRKNGTMSSGIVVATIAVKLNLEFAEQDIREKCSDFSTIPSFN